MFEDAARSLDALLRSNGGGGADLVAQTSAAAIHGTRLIASTPKVIAEKYVLM